MSALALPHPLRAVVIDAHPRDSQQAATVCRQAGLTVAGCAASAGAGLELLDTQRADVVVADLYLPDMDGADLIQSLSMLPRRPHLVVCSTADARLLDATYTLAESLGMPVLAALPKPLQPELLQRALSIAPPPAPPRVASPQPPVSAMEIRDGIARREFHLAYQPKIALPDMTLVGVEALLRWQHPGLGRLSPCVFLGTAHRADLLGALTVEAMRLALADWRQWQRSGLALPVSLNLSAGLLSDPFVAAQLIGMATAAGMPPDCLTFEITEDTELTDLAAALRVLVKLRLGGFGLSLDDYGVGYSSMLRLSRIPFTELKIDRSLVHNAWARPHLLPFLRSAIGLARDLGIQAVAEGVETAQDLQLLQQLGCDQAQGYYLARPMPAAALLRWRGPGRR